MRPCPVADRDDDIEVIVPDIARCLPDSLGLNCCIFRNSCLLSAFSLSKYAAHVVENHRSIALEQRRHLSEGQPYGFSPELHLHADTAACGLVEEDLGIGFFTG